MAAQPEFIESYREGKVVFFAGAGVSRDSGAIMPLSILEAAADIFLPAVGRNHPDIQRILAGSPNLPSFGGIQPEIFYENLLSIVEDQEALALWRILSPKWLADNGARLEPNINHRAIVKYSACFGLPVFTMNFDTLFEAAADELRVPCQVIIPSSGSPIPSAEERTPGKLRLFKLHGSIMVKGEERLDTLQLTMQGISTVNHSVIRLLQHLGAACELTFIGYSGRDIDYFPVLAASGLGQRSFWFNPLGEQIVRDHANRIRAREIVVFSRDLFMNLEPDIPAGKCLDSAPLLERLKREMCLQLSDSQKKHLLAMCLHSVGENDRAAAVLADWLVPPFEPEGADWIEALLLKARVEDCLSHYDDSAASAKAALAALRKAWDRGTTDFARDTALRARALYHKSMAQQQQIGPSISYGDPFLDWGPSRLLIFTKLLAGAAVSIRLAALRRRLRRLVPRSRQLAFTRAEHAINDHNIMLLGRIITATERLGLVRMRSVGSILSRLVRKTLQAASSTGDYFNYAHAHKYLSRLRAIETPDEALATYGLLRDPLNYALVLRDAAVIALEKGDRKAAASKFREALVASMACGSRATALKSLIGLAACRSLTAADRVLLQQVGDDLQGEGYQRFRRERLGPLLDAVPPKSAAA